MGYVKPDAYDIFVSYASVNNLRPMPARKEEKWVDFLANEIKGRVDESLGKRGLCSPFTDRGLAGNFDFEQEIVKALDGAAVLLLVLSTGYLESEWCLKEVGRFYEVFKKRRNAGDPVFVIEYEPVEKPGFLKNVTGYQFWAQNPLNVKPPYYTIGYLREDKDQDAFDKQVRTLVYELAEELKRLRKAVAPGPAARGLGDGAAPAVASGTTAGNGAKATEATSGAAVASARDDAVARDVAVITVFPTAAEAAGPTSEDAATDVAADPPQAEAEAAPAPLVPDPPAGDGQPSLDELRRFVTILSMIESESQRRNLPLSVARIGGFSPTEIAACFDQLLRRID